MKLPKMNAGQIIGAISGILLIVGSFLPWVQGRVMGMLTVYGIHLAPNLPGIEHGLLSYLDGYILIIFGITSAIFLLWNKFTLRVATLIISIISFAVVLYDLLHAQLLYEDFVGTDVFNGPQLGLFLALFATIGLCTGSIVNLFIKKHN